MHMGVIYKEKRVEIMDEMRFEEETFKLRYELIKRMQIRDAVAKYREEAREEEKEEARYVVLQSEVRKNSKAKSLYSLAGEFQNWKDAEKFTQEQGHCIIVDTEKVL